MAEYAILFLLLFLSFLATTLATRSMAISIIFSFFYACADEFHQTFVDSRASGRRRRKSGTVAGRPREFIPICLLFFKRIVYYFSGRFLPLL